MTKITYEEWRTRLAELPEEKSKEAHGAAPIEWQKMLRKEVLTVYAQTFSPQGFVSFFELMHDVPLHQEALEWVKNVFRALKGRKKLLQKCFRGSGKTTVLSKMFLAYWIGHHPHTTNGIIRVNSTKANETCSEIKEMIENDPNWKLVFPHVIPDKELGWGQNSGYFVKRDDMTVSEWKDVQRKTTRPQGATLIGYGYDSGSVQGFRVNGILVIDDIHVKENTRSDRQLEDVKDFIKFQLKQVLVPNEAIEIWNYTPWLTNDAYAEREATGLYILSESPVMRRAEDGEGVFWPEKLGDEQLDETNYPFSNQWWHLSWPERWGIKEIAEIYKDIGHIPFMREYALDLEATKGQNLKKEWLHYYPYERIDPSWPVYLGVDYASTVDKLKNKDRDYFTVALCRAVPGGGLVLFDGFRGHVSRAEGLQKVANYCGMYSGLVQLAGVESLGKGEEFYNDLVMMNDIRGVPLPIMEIKHGRKSKGDRFEDWLAPRFQMSRIWVSNAPNPFLYEFENEWLMWPAGEHDDCLDAVYMCAFAGEGALPSLSPRTTSAEKKPSPFAALRNR